MGSISVEKTDSFKNSTFAEIPVGGFFSKHDQLYMKHDIGGGSRSNAIMIDSNLGGLCASSFRPSDSVLGVDVHVRWKVAVPQ